MWKTPTIMSWQIGNEPRAFSGENKEAFAIWMAEVSRFHQVARPESSGLNR